MSQQFPALSFLSLLYLEDNGQNVLLVRFNFEAAPPAYIWVSPCEPVVLEWRPRNDLGVRDHVAALLDHVGRLRLQPLDQAVEGSQRVVAVDLAERQLIQEGLDRRRAQGTQGILKNKKRTCLLYTSPSPRD